MNKVYYNITINNGAYKIVEQSHKPKKHDSCADILEKIKQIGENNLSYQLDSSDPYSKLDSVALKRKLFRIADEVTERYDSKVRKINVILRLIFNFSKKILPLRLAISRLKGVPSLESIHTDLFHLIVRKLNVLSFLQLARTNRALYSRCEQLLSTADLTQFFTTRVTFRPGIWSYFDGTDGFPQVYNHFAHFRLFITLGPLEPYYKYERFILESLRSSDLRVLQFCLHNSSRIHINAFEYAAARAVYTALVNRREDIACLLLERVRRDTNYFLWYAVEFGCTLFIEKAILLGWNVNLQDDKGNTPLSYAVSHNKQDMVALLMRNGADPLIRNKYGETAENWAPINPNILALIQSFNPQRRP